MTTYKQLIGGEWCDASSGRTKSVLNPATEEPVREVPYGAAADCKSAIEAAAGAFPSWARKTPYERGAILKRAADLMRARADDIARTTVLESGKPLVQARGEWMVSADPIGQEMLRQPSCAKIHLTGSLAVGKRLMDGASQTMKRLSLELGGNAPVLIFPDVDLEQLAPGAIAAKFRNGGQVCIAPQRFLVAKRIEGRFVG